MAVTGAPDASTPSNDERPLAGRRFEVDADQAGEPLSAVEALERNPLLPVDEEG